MEFQFLSSYMRSIYTMKWPSTTIVWLSLLESGEKVKFVENSFISWIYNSSQWKWICRQCVVGLSSQFHHCVKLTWKWGGQKQIYANWIFLLSWSELLLYSNFHFSCVWTTVQMPFSNGKNDQIQKGEIQKKFSFSDAGMAGGL